MTFNNVVGMVDSLDEEIRSHIDLIQEIFTIRELGKLDQHIAPPAPPFGPENPPQPG
jgi:hypothetical protein